MQQRAKAEDRTTRWRKFSAEYTYAPLESEAADVSQWPAAPDKPQQTVIVREEQPLLKPTNPVAARAVEWDGFRTRLNNDYRQIEPRYRQQYGSPLLEQTWWPLLVLGALGAMMLVWHVLAMQGDQSTLSRFYSGASAAITVNGVAGTLGGQVELIDVGSAASAAFLPLPGDGPFRLNVVAALEANGGALQQVVIPPGGSWSFNRAIGDPSGLTLATIAGVYGGGWCDLASRYVVALRPLLPPEALAFIRHRDATGIGLAGVSDDDGVAIWNTNNSGGEQDLIVRNPSNRTLVISTRLSAEGVDVRAAFQ